MLSYCLKCREKTNSTNVTTAVTKKGNNYLTAKCEKCGGKKAIMTKKTTEGEGLGYRGKGLGFR